MLNEHKTVPIILKLCQHNWEKPNNEPKRLVYYNIIAAGIYVLLRAINITESLVQWCDPLGWVKCGLDIGECAVDCGLECISCIWDSIEQCIGCLTAVDVIKNIGTHLYNVMTNNTSTYSL